jgi:hypothetical protein
MVTAIPIAGQPIVQWLWIVTITIKQIFQFFYYLSDCAIHFFHKDGSNSPIGSDTGG